MLQKADGFADTIHNVLFNDSVLIDDSMRNGAEYNGSELKFGVNVNNNRYILKQQKRDWLNVQSELIASRFIKHLGGSVHEVLPGIYQGRQVVLCRDFTTTDCSLKTLASLNSSSIDTDDSRHEYYIEDVTYELSKIRNLDVIQAMYQFYKMFIYDAILGNPDRHKGNFGILSYNDGSHEFAPVFDNGACLFPRNHEYSINDAWMCDRIFTFPNSKIMFCSRPLRERSSYYQVIKDGRIPKNVLDWAQGLNVVQAMHNTCNDFGIAEKQASYYKTIVHYRHECIIKQNDFRWVGML